MKWIDLFAGAGMATEAAKQAGCEVLAAVEFGYARAKSDKLDRSPLLTYVANHGNHVIQQDVRTLRGWQFDTLDPDGIMGGPPCQDFSIAGPRTGLDGYRGTLTFEFLRVAAESSAAWVLMENVPGLLTSNEGNDIRSIVLEAERLGLRPAWAEPANFLPKAYHLFSAAQYGTPQMRRRVFFLWNKNGDTVAIPAITHKKPVSMASALGITLTSERPAPTIDAGGTKTGGWDVGQRSRKLLKKMGFRGRLNVEQCAILQGLPASYQLVGTKTSRHRQIGNGWPIQLGKAIFCAIKEADEEASLSKPKPA